MNVLASDLNSYCFCPRAVYLSKVLKIKPEPSAAQSRGLISHAVRKELSLRQPKLLRKAADVNNIGNVFEEELDRLLKDVPHIYRNLLCGIDFDVHIGELRSELLQESAELVKRLRLMVEDVGLGEAVRILTPRWVEYSVRSDALMLSGRIDKVMEEPSYAPVEIKTGVVPSNIWEGDRVQTCAYAMLLEDRLCLNEIIRFGFVEYTRIHERRPVLTTEKLRRSVVMTRDSVLDIIGGVIPEICPHGNGKKCEACGFKEQCYDI